MTVDLELKVRRPDLTEDSVRANDDSEVLMHDPKVLATLNDGVVVSGSVSVSNFPAGFNVNNLPTIQDVAVQPDAALRRYAILNDLVPDTEEIKLDVQELDEHIYMGAAVEGSAESASVWDIVRVEFDTTGQKPRGKRIQIGVRWDQKELGW